MLRPTSILRAAAAILLMGSVEACETGDAVRLQKYEQLRIATGATAILPSHVFCGGEDKQARGPGGCFGKATDSTGRIRAIERTEIRGWISAREAPDWAEADEVSFNVLLDWGWQLYAAGLQPINTPESVVRAVTPHNIIKWGTDPTDRSTGRSFLPGTGASAWGGPHAAVIHVESQAWRRGPLPPDWNKELTHESGSPTSMFAVNPFSPPSMEQSEAPEPLKVGDYVRVVGTLWEDTYHPPDDPPFGVGVVSSAIDNEADSASLKWRDGTFGQGISYCPPGSAPPHCAKGRGWIELHPVDYMARLDQPAKHTDALEIVAMAGEGEVTRSIALPPKPSPTARVVFRKIDTGFTLLNTGDLELEDIATTSVGINVHIKLKARSGIAPGYPKYFAGFYVYWEL